VPKAVRIAGLTLAGADAGNYVLADRTAATTGSITPASIAAISGITAADKVYDGTTTASVDTAHPVFAGAVAGDQLLVAAATGRFADKNAGDAKVVSISGLALGGADAGNYTLAHTTASAAASITPATLTAITGLTALDKVFDGSTRVPLALGQVQFTGRIGSDDLGIASARGQFADAAPGTAKAVQVDQIVLGGADAANYRLAQPTLSTVANLRDLPAQSSRDTSGTSGTRATEQGGAAARAVTVAPSTAPALAVPAEASGTPVGTTPTAAAAAAVRVDLLKPALDSTAGLVSVSVPTPTLRAGAFGFALPDSVARPADSVSASLPDGRALPDWIRFDPGAQRFNITQVPAGLVFPIEVRITVNGRSTLMSIDTRD
jgi:hypothetical protein